jgi:hypothetical protein
MGPWGMQPGMVMRMLFAMMDGDGTGSAALGPSPLLTTVIAAAGGAGDRIPAEHVAR